MAETLDLVSEEAIEKARKERSGGRSRSGVRRLRQGRREGAEDASREPSAAARSEGDEQLEPSEGIVSIAQDADPAGGTGKAQGTVGSSESRAPEQPQSDRRPTTEPSQEDRPLAQEIPAAARPTPPVIAHPDAGKFLTMYRIQGGTLLYWRKESIDDWDAPVLGAACKALLEGEQGQDLIFDFSNVCHLSTQALATLIRFQKAVALLQQRLVLVSGGDLRELLKKSRVTGLFEIRSEIHSLILPEMTFETRPAAAGKIARSSNLFSHFCRDFFISLRRVLI